MTWIDKLELGLKENAPFRKDNLPPDQVRGPEIDLGPGRSPEIPMARGDKTEFADVPEETPPPAAPHDTTPHAPPPPRPKSGD